MATEADKILALQAGAQRRACVVRVFFTLFIASHFNSGLSRMKILSGMEKNEDKTYSSTRPAGHQKIVAKIMMTIPIAIDEIKSRRKVNPDVAGYILDIHC